MFNNISQEFERLRSFSFYIMGDATRWLAYLPNDFITTWDKLTNAFFERLFPPLQIVKLHIQIQNFKRNGGETLDIAEVQKVTFAMSNGCRSS